MWETFRGGPGDLWPVVDEGGGVFSTRQGSRARTPGNSGSGQVPASLSSKHHKERSRDPWRSKGTRCGDLKDEDELGMCPGRRGGVCGGWPSICSVAVETERSGAGQGARSEMRAERAGARAQGQWEPRKCFWW